jgi:ribonuclease H / adenosylcobalamin/alpha-ribazole phosphatase
VTVPDPSAGSAPDPQQARPAGFGGAPTTLVLARHGRTEHTETRLLSGGGSDPGLSAAGLRDARLLAAAVAVLGGPVPGLKPITRVQVSPQRRARETLAEVLAVAPAPVGTQVQDGWQEICFGEWEGMALRDLVARHPDVVARWFDATAVAPPGGESVQQLRTRVTEQVRRTVAEHPGEVVLVVTHGGPVASVVSHALDAGTGALWRVMVEPCSLTVVRFWRDGGIQVVTVNSTGHLADPERDYRPEW